MDADVVVVGAGALGLSTALHCALAGRCVVVVDRLTAAYLAACRLHGVVVHENEPQRLETVE